MPLLDVREVTKAFGGVRAVDGVSLQVNEGETVGLIGPNGAGKSTLFSLISGFRRPDQGTIIFAGQDVTAMPPHRRSQHGIAITFQHTRPFLSMSAYDSVLTAAFVKGGPARQAHEQAEHWLAFVGMDHLADVPVRELNFPQRKKLELARAMATKPRLLMLDEIVAGLNPQETGEMIRLVGRLREWGVTLFVIEHVMAVIMSLSDRIIVLHHGQKLAEGSPQEVTQDPRVIEAYLGRRQAAC